ncbi:MAG: type II toxin-antitoxin system Phd/YefM family antitoxin [Leptospirales bacterium]
MRHSYSIAEAKSHLATVVHRAETGEIVHITRRGKPVAVLLSEEVYDRIVAGARPGIWESIQAFRQRHDEEPVEILDSDFTGLRSQEAERGPVWD